MSYRAVVEFGFPIRQEPVVLEEEVRELLPGAVPPIFGRFRRREIAVAEVSLGAGERRKTIMTVTSAGDREERYVDSRLDLSSCAPYDIMLSEPVVRTTVFLRMLRR